MQPVGDVEMWREIWNYGGLERHRRDEWRPVTPSLTSPVRQVEDEYRAATATDVNALRAEMIALREQLAQSGKDADTDR